MSEHELPELGRRIERLTLAPDEISAPFHRLLRPIFHRIGWRPRSEIDALRKLVAVVDAHRRGDATREDCMPSFEAALDELEDNLEQVERATVINERVLVPYAAWLRRCYEIVVMANRALSHFKALPPAGPIRPADPDAATMAGLRDEAAILPPLSMRRARKGIDSKVPDDDREDTSETVADPTRVLELQLDTIDHLMAAAREDDALLGRRRRLLHAARQLLLETSAALSLDDTGVQARLQNIGREITLLNRYQAMGLRPDVAMLHQARTALSRGEHDKLFASLSMLQRRAADVGDGQVTALTTRALGRLTGEDSGRDHAHASLVRSGEEVLGSRVVAAISDGYAQARQIDHDQGNDPDSHVAAVIKQYYAPGREHDTLAHALAVDGSFEVGGTLSPVRITEEFIVPRVVPYPTQQLRLVKAEGPGDIATSVIQDPRTVVMDLAAGRLLARRYVRDEIRTQPKTVMQGEVRVYLLDGSTSMLGARARMRDAILVAELATLLERLENPRKNTRVVLFYRYFNALLEPVYKVDAASDAIEAIREVTATPRRGGTDIQGALLSSLSLIRDEQQRDPDLSHAQIVLITDGEAKVNERRISEARHALGTLPVGISVIALGEENHALRDIVARQRARSEQAFYHFMPDEHLERLSDRRIDNATMVHLPSVPQASARESLAEQIGPLMERLSDLQRSRESSALRDLDRVDREHRVAPGELDTSGEGERARLEALYRDDVALDRRYKRWFPPAVAVDPSAEPPGMPPEGTRERDDLDSVVVVLATIAEVTETVGSYRRGRQADAIDLLERLLPDARLTPARYHEILRLYAKPVAAALSAVHGAARSGLGWRLETSAAVSTTTTPKPA